jgi:enoyl-CoA hydratase/carnithine racemase
MKPGRVADIRDVAAEVSAADVELDDDGVLWVTIATERCELSQEDAWCELGTIFDSVSIADDVRVVVVRGPGNGAPFTTYVPAVFSRAAASSRPKASASRYPSLSMPHPMWMLFRVYRNMLVCPQPIICSVNGDAITAATTFSQHCDLVLAAEDVSFGDQHVRMGLNSTVGSYIWPVYANLHKAKEYLFTGRLLSAHDAFDLGLVNRVVPGAELHRETEEIARELAQAPRHAVRWMKRITNKDLLRATLESQGEGMAWGALSTFTDEYRAARS